MLNPNKSQGLQSGLMLTSLTATYCPGSWPGDSSSSAMLPEIFLQHACQWQLGVQAPKILMRAKAAVSSVLWTPGSSPLTCTVPGRETLRRPVGHRSVTFSNLLNGWGWVATLPWRVFSYSWAFVVKLLDLYLLNALRYLRYKTGPKAVGWSPFHLHRAHRKHHHKTQNWP